MKNPGFFDGGVKLYRFPYAKKQNCDSEITLAVKSFTDKEVDVISVQRDKYGKPHIVGADNVFVSVTHDKDVCLVAVSTQNIGIDMERKDRKVKNPLSLAKRYFCDDEIASLGENFNSEDFIEMWVKKEALSKLIGKGVPCMKEKSVFSDDLIFCKPDICYEYIVYYVFYKQ